MPDIDTIPFSTDIETMDIMYSAEELQGFNRAFFNNGLSIKLAGNADLQISGNLQISIAPLSCHIDGTLSYSNITNILAVDTANSLPRIDSVIIRRDAVQRKSTLLVVKGTPSGSPQPPVLTEIPEGIFEFRLYDIFVDAYSVAIVQQDITDRRKYMFLPTQADLDNKLNIAFNNITPQGTINLEIAINNFLQNNIALLTNLLNQGGGIKMRGLDFSNMVSINATTGGQNPGAGGGYSNPYIINFDGMILSTNRPTLHIASPGSSVFSIVSAGLSAGYGMNLPVSAGTKVYETGSGNTQIIIVPFLEE